MPFGFLFTFNRFEPQRLITGRGFAGGEVDELPKIKFDFVSLIMLRELYTLLPLAVSFAWRGHGSFLGGHWLGNSLHCLSLLHWRFDLASPSGNRLENAVEISF
jgi:hypothetical protein